MKKVMCGNSIVKACFYGLGVSVAIRTVYLDKEGDEKEKLRDCGYEIEWLYNQEEKCIVGLDGRMIFKVNGARLRKI